jgi:hypothetical protein
MGVQEPIDEEGSIHPPAERNSIRAEDRAAVPALVGILIAIFTLALVGYLTIAILTFLALGGG